MIILLLLARHPLKHQYLTEHVNPTEENGTIGKKKAMQKEYNNYTLCVCACVHAHTQLGQSLRSIWRRHYAGVGTIAPKALLTFLWKLGSNTETETGAHKASSMQGNHIRIFSKEHGTAGFACPTLWGKPGSDVMTSWCCGIVISLLWGQDEIVCPCLCVCLTAFPNQYNSHAKKTHTVSFTQE